MGLHPQAHSLSLWSTFVGFQSPLPHSSFLSFSGSGVCYQITSDYPARETPLVGPRDLRLPAPLGWATSQAHASLCFSQPPCIALREREWKQSKSHAMCCKASQGFMPRVSRPSIGPCLQKLASNCVSHKSLALPPIQSKVRSPSPPTYLPAHAEQETRGWPLLTACLKSSPKIPCLLEVVTSNQCGSDLAPGEQRGLIATRMYQKKISAFTMFSGMEHNVQAD